MMMVLPADGPMVLMIRRRRLLLLGRRRGRRRLVLLPAGIGERLSASYCVLSTDIVAPVDTVATNISQSGRVSHQPSRITD